MKEIGVQKTQLDTLVLHENIALSMADVLTFNTAIFIKQYGRATLSTVAFRGTAASHTQVMWNGMRINSPMLGMTDFSMIPSYFVDDATLLHGTSSLNVVGGGLGGAITLATKPADTHGFKMQYRQGRPFRAERLVSHLQARPFTNDRRLRRSEGYSAPAARTHPAQRTLVGSSASYIQGRSKSRLHPHMARLRLRP